MTAEPRRAVVSLPGGLRVRMVWGAGGQAAQVFALSEVGGSTADLGSLAGPDPDALSRAEVRVESPAGTWTVRLASRVGGEPFVLAWDTVGALAIAYGLLAYAFDARAGTLLWTHRTGAPVVALLGSPRLPHVLVQSEVETFALLPDGAVAWRVAHADVVTAAALVGGRLILSSYGGETAAFDPVTGRPAG